MTTRLKPIAVPLGIFALAILLSALCGPRGPLLLARQSASTSCNDPVALPVCVRKILSDGGPGGSTTDTSAGALSSLQTDINKIWATCCISFTLTAGDSVTLPADSFKNGKLPVANFDGQHFNLNKGTKKLFDSSNSTKCLNLYYVGDAIAGGLKPGQDLKGVAPIGENGAIVDDGASAALDAHELGHNLGLPDVDKKGDLMNGVDAGGNIATGLTTGQCDDAKKMAKKYLKEFNKPNK
jgi:hypothetical protein